MSSASVAGSHDVQNERNVLTDMIICVTVVSISVGKCLTTTLIFATARCTSTAIDCLFALSGGSCLFRSMVCLA